MSNVAIGPVKIALRKPRYSMWNRLERSLYRECEYSLHIPYGQRVFTPWFETDRDTSYANAMRKVEAGGRLGVSLNRCFVMHHLAGSALRAFPDSPLAECGVYTGGTAQLIALAIQDSTERMPLLHLFHSFEGMPQSSVPERDYQSPGDYGDTSQEAVEERLKAFPNLKYHAGFIPDTFPEVNDVSGYSFVHVDVDIFPSVAACLQWLWPKLISRGVMVFDDYEFFPYPKSARVAVDELE